MLRIAVIGMGSRVSHMFKGIGARADDVRLAAVADPDEAGVRERLAKAEVAFEGVRFCQDAERMLEHAEDFDGVMIGTRCHLHTEMAVKVAKTGLPLFLEKPVAITFEQLEALHSAFAGREEKVVVSFPLRCSNLFRAAKEIVKSGRIGTVNQVTAINNVEYGGGYFTSWYREMELSGGLWMQKATHDVDYINDLIDAPPTLVAALSARQVYGGTMPERSADTGIQDAGSAIIHYADGTIASYSQNFVTRKPAGKRGAIITGEKGTVEFDWYAQELRFYDHVTGTMERTEYKSPGGHGGGDFVLQQDFIDLIRDGKPPAANLRHGLVSAAVCLGARASHNTQTFQRIASFEPGARSGFAPPRAVEDPGGA